MSTGKNFPGEWHNGRWLTPIDVLPDEQRTMPETRPDELAYDHMEKRFGCSCDVCQRPAAARWKEKWRRDQRRMVWGVSSTSSVS